MRAGFNKIFSITFSLIILVSAVVLPAFPHTNAQEIDTGSYIKGKVMETGDERIENGLYSQSVTVKLEDGSIIDVIHETQSAGSIIKYEKGDNVIVHKFSAEGSERYIITDHNRMPFLIVLFGLFAAISLLIGRKHGFFSFVGMAFSFFVLFTFVLPQIMAGRSPVLITVFASFFIVPVTFYLSHGISKKTHVAVISTFIVLIITSILAAVSVSLARLTGFASEEARFLQLAHTSINMRGILLSGIIIGFLGVLDDITVSQASVVTQLKEANPNLGTLELYRRAMAIGRDHITSLVNTLVLVYTGASMPLLLLFINNPQPAYFVLNTEIIADEIVRTLTGSIGLIMAVPIATFFASIVAEVE